MEDSEKRIEILRQTWGNQGKPRAPREAPATGLLTLPIEVRLQIYHHCIPRWRIVEVAYPRFVIPWTSNFNEHWDETDLRIDSDVASVFAHDSASEDDVIDSRPSDDILDYWSLNTTRNSIFLLSKQISEETLDILYGENVFKLYLNGNGEYHLEENFSEPNRQRMQYLLLVGQPRGTSYTPGHVVNVALWATILPHLKSLRIVFEQPVEAGGYYNAPTLEQEMEDWISWVRPIIQCLGKYLSEETNVEIDYDGRAETGVLAKKYLQHGYREMQCRLGDLIFKRGSFSLESGYWNDDGPMSSRDFDGDWSSD